MIVHRIELTNFRGFEDDTFDFGPGMNLIAGVNGAGKSSVLDALRITLSRSLAKDFTTKEQPIPHGRSDFRYGSAFWTLLVNYSLTEEPSPFEFLAHVNLEGHSTANTTEVRHGSVMRPDQFDFLNVGTLGTTVPICVYFSPQRTLVENRTQPAEAGADGARARAFAERALNIWHLSQWWTSQLALANETPAAKVRAAAVKDTLLTFLPEFKDVRPIGGEQPDLIFTKGRSELSAGQLSDGERGVMSLVLELARRFSLAFPQDESPFLHRSGCVMIDELELHLHPQWQREIVGKLERTFPKCQFIVTTHSPQVIGEVAHERVHMIGKAPLDQTLGMDSSWILRNVMDTPDRPSATIEELVAVEKALKDKNPEEALRLVKKIEEEFGVFDQLQALRTKAELMLRLKK